ncbi:hypothetical protein DDE82_008254 [Stemphylium lycopersici]|uniref:Uncharacterized protein n=1 Tax=Stemphylium lycopersici TaxID=183478 RepID=A0A364N5G2_STELY|nr:hypothetical protein TW65_04458 [Stemphylium lycopersici]RAQ99434.1 hypothetical protein DDE82_008254 [Stemphylium lycopersici]RAR12243.1 hypothetical protein DDE83_004130 [Stemphylium lycopersici]
MGRTFMKDSSQSRSQDCELNPENLGLDFIENK